MTPPERPRSPLWMVVLSLACEEPMHPYRMQTLIKERGKDQIANVAQRNSVYQAIDALERAGLIVVRETSREERRPERTIYGATELGRRTLRSWLRAVLSTPAREFPDFPAALSLIAGLEPAEVVDLIEARIPLLEARRAELEKPVPGLPRLFLLESEYLATVVRAEIKWLKGVVADLRSRRLTWSEAWIRRVAAQMQMQMQAQAQSQAASSPAQPPRSRSSRRAPRAAPSRRRR
jgi:DNA-binding PadR family transcriptional regulator